MNRLYVIEATPSITGAMADHRIALRPSEIPNFAGAIAAKMGLSVQVSADAGRSQWIDALVRDLQKHRGTSAVVAGDQQPPAIHALAHWMNQALDNVGKTVIYTDPIEANPVGQLASLRELVKDMESGTVKILSCWTATRYSHHPWTLALRNNQRKFRCVFIRLSMKTRPRPIVTGIFLRPIIWKLGATFAPMTVR